MVSCFICKVGGIQSVTLGDEEAKRRGVQKSILERAGPPTFDVAVEMLERTKWRLHMDVGKVRKRLETFKIRSANIET